MSSPFRSAMAAFEELPALTDDDLRVLLRSLGTDQLRRVMGIGHSALLQMDAHYATRIQLRDQALALAKQTMASPQGVAPPTAPLAPISKAKATATVAKAKEPVVKPMPSAPPPASSPSTTAEVDQASTGAAPATSTQAAASTTPATGKAVGPMSKPDAPQPAPQAVAAAACAKAGAGTGAGGPPKTTSSTSTQPPPATKAVQQKKPPVVPGYNAPVASDVFMDTVSQDLELMQEPPVTMVPKTATPAPPQRQTTETFFDDLVPDLENYLPAPPAVVVEASRQ